MGCLGRSEGRRGDREGAVHGKRNDKITSMKGTYEGWGNRSGLGGVWHVRHANRATAEPKARLLPYNASAPGLVSPPQPSTPPPLTDHESNPPRPPSPPPLPSLQTGTSTMYPIPVKISNKDELDGNLLEDQGEGGAVGGEGGSVGEGGEEQQGRGGRRGGGAAGERGNLLEDQGEQGAEGEGRGAAGERGGRANRGQQRNRRQQAREGE